MCGPGFSNHRPGRALLGSSRKPEVQSHGCVGRQRQWASQACCHLSLGPRNLRWGPRAPLQKLFPILATGGVGSTQKFLLPSLCSVSSGRGGARGHEASDPCAAVMKQRAEGRPTWHPTPVGDFWGVCPGEHVQGLSHRQAAYNEKI